jgi:hypothetical protein
MGSLRSQDHRTARLTGLFVVCLVMLLSPIASAGISYSQSRISLEVDQTAPSADWSSSASHDSNSGVSAPTSSNAPPILADSGQANAASATAPLSAAAAVVPEPPAVIPIAPAGPLGGLTLLLLAVPILSSRKMRRWLLR